MVFLRPSKWVPADSRRHAVEGGESESLKTIYLQSVVVVFWFCSGLNSARNERMLAPLSSLTREDMETRRLAAANDLLSGVTQSQVARRYGVSRTTASRWHRSIVHKGFEGMRRRRATGRPSRLTADQVDAIRKMYFEGAAAYGFANDRWTTGRLAVAIARRFGVRYDQD